MSSYTKPKPIADSVPQHLCYSMERPQVLGLCGHGNDNEKETTMVKEDEDELELGLGLSLGGVVNKAISNKNFNSYGRILTAKDLLNGFSCGNKRERSAATDHDDHGSSSAAAVSQVVGWPPIRSYRMSTMFSQPKNSNIEEDDNNRDVRKADNENSNKKMNHGNEKIEKNGIKERSVIGFVKVNMDGLPIGRKVDLNAQKSYETLAKTLEDMFFTTRGEKEQSTHHGPKLLDASSEFVLTYEDKEGDWMLLGDVPWRMFLNTVRRLRIMRTSEANGLAPKLQEKNEKQRAIPT